MIIHTIGFTKKPLRRFVELVQTAGVDAVVDVRLRNTGQLAGWSKRDDLAFILETFGIAYHHRPDVAPSDELLSRYRKDHDWESYEQIYPRLLEERSVYAGFLDFLDQFERPCFLCTEPGPEHCHRRLLCEQLAARRPGLEVVHLV